MTSSSRPTWVAKGFERLGPDGADQIKCFDRALIWAMAGTFCIWNFKGARAGMGRVGMRAAKLAGTPGSNATGESTWKALDELPRHVSRVPWQAAKLLNDVAIDWIDAQHGAGAFLAGAGMAAGTSTPRDRQMLKIVLYEIDSGRVEDELARRPVAPSTAASGPASGGRRWFSAAGRPISARSAAAWQGTSQ